MTRAIGIEIVGDYGSGPAIKEAVGDLRQFALMSDKATSSVERLAGQRANLKMLAVAYQDVAASAVKGSDEQQIAAKLAADANAKLAASVRVTGGSVNSASGALQKHNKILGDTEKEARGGIASFTGLGRAMFFASNAFLGGALIGGALKSIVDKTREADMAMGQLRLSVRDAGSSWQTMGGQIDATLTKQKELSQFTEAQLATGLNKLVLSTGSVTKAERELAIATDLARMKNEDLATATQQVAQAGLGHTVVLRGLQIAVPKVTTASDALKEELKQLKAAHEQLTPAELSHAKALAVASDQAKTGAGALDKLAGATKGADQTFSNSSAGGMAKFTRSLDDLEVSVGPVLMSDITNLIGKLSAWMDHLNATGKAQRDAKEAADLLSHAIHAAGVVIHDVDQITGGFKNTLELLIGLKVGLALAGWSSKMGLFGTQAEIAEGKVATLRGSLMGLGAIAIAPIVIPIVVAISNKEKSWIQKHLGKAGAALFDGVMTVAGGGIIGGPGAVYKDLTGGGNSPTQTQTNVTSVKGPGGASGYTGGSLNYRTMAEQAASRYGVPTGMFLAQINQESGFNPNAKSGAGAEGIAQFMPATAKGMGVNPMDPASALLGAAKMMAQLKAKYGTWEAALSAYNSGNPNAYKDPSFAGGQTSNYVKSIMGASGGASYAGANATPIPAKPKKPAIISGANEIPAALQKAIANATSAIKTTRGETALGWVDQEQQLYVNARKALQGIVAGQGGKQAAATQKEIDALTAKIKAPPTIKAADLLPQKLLDSIASAKDAATSSSGATAETYLVREKTLLKKAEDDLKGELAGQTPKQKAAIHAEMDKINTSIAGVTKSIAANLKAQASAIKSNAASAISQGRATITSAFSNLVNDIKNAFQTETQNYIDHTLGPQFFQGLQTPLESKLVGMQSADTAQGLTDSLTTAQKQLALDQATVGVTADQIATDQKAVAQAQRAIDENNLSIQATAQRKQADEDYAAAVKQYQRERSDAEHSMNVALTDLGKGIANNTQTLDGPGGLSDVLGKFGVSMADVPVDQWSSDMDTLSSATQDLALVFIAEAKALAKIGDSKDANAAAAAAAALGTMIGASSLGAGLSTATLGNSGDISGHRMQIPGLAGGGDIRAAGLAYLHPGERVQPASVVNSGGGGSVYAPTFNFPNYVGDKRDLAAAVKSPQMIEAVATAVILASRGGHIRQGDIRP